MQIRRLREETEADHQVVEASLSLMADELRREDYLSALERMCGIVSAWELLVETKAPPELLPLVQTRARRMLLEADIHAHQGHIPTAMAPLPQLASRSEFLGALYVMEGSRLGGQFIARHVEIVLGLENGLGTSYFRGFGEKTGSYWKELLGVMEADIPEREADSTIAAAKGMFRAFNTWMTGIAHTSSPASPSKSGELFHV